MPVIVLDRDGVINQDSEHYIKSEEEWVAIPGSIEALADLYRGGFRIAIATNQSGIGRGYFDEFTLARIHDKLRSMVELAGGSIEGIFYCPHTPSDDCNCRKPRTGMLEQIEFEFGGPLLGSYFIGDSRKDIDAAIDYQLNPILVETGNGAQTAATLRRDSVEGILQFSDLRTAVDHILRER